MPQPRLSRCQPIQSPRDSAVDISLAEFLVAASPRWQCNRKSGQGGDNHEVSHILHNAILFIHWD